MKTLQIPLIAGAILVMICTTALAETTDPLCALVDASLLSALQLSDAKPVARKETKSLAGFGTIDITTCAWSSNKAKDRALSVTSTPFPGAMPVSCNTKPHPEKTMTLCMAAASGTMVTVVLMQSGDKSDPTVTATLRSHTEAMVAKLGKTAK